MGTAITDAELIIASRRDPQAFRELYDRWPDRLLAYLYRRVLDPEVAADLLAETVGRGAVAVFPGSGRDGARASGRDSSRCQRTTARSRRASPHSDAP
jgi:DNA-directed RNA polymerase specialized sigma24 family protein